MENKFAWLTLLATDNFLPGVIILNNSLKKVNSKYPLIIITTNNLAKDTFNKLEEENIQYRVFPYVSFFCTGDRNAKFWGNNFNKENVWWDCTLAKNYMFLFLEYDKVCFLDADITILNNCDDYFAYPVPAAFTDEHTDGMRGGVILVNPSIKDYLKCMEIGVKEGVVNDEMVWCKWQPDFRDKMLDHHFPQWDLSENNKFRKVFHDDGFNKAWLI